MSSECLTNNVTSHTLEEYKCRSSALTTMDLIWGVKIKGMILISFIFWLSTKCSRSYPKSIEVRVMLCPENKHCYVL